MTSIEQTLLEMVGTQVKEIEELRQFIAQQAQKIEELLAVIEELRGGRKDSHNSSKPPSSDGYSKKPVPKSLRKANGRKQGRQAGHKGNSMKISQEPDQVIQHPGFLSGMPEGGKLVRREYAKDGMRSTSLSSATSLCINRWSAVAPCGQTRPIKGGIPERNYWHKAVWEQCNSVYYSTAYGRDSKHRPGETVHGGRCWRQNEHRNN